MNSKKKIFLFSNSEIKTIYDYPVFSEEEKQFYLYLTEDELSVSRQLRTLEGKTYFTLMICYFRAKNILFKICFQRSAHDISYLLKTLFPSKNFSNKIPAKKTITKINSLVIQTLKISDQSLQKKMIATRIDELIRYNTVPANIFKELMSYMENHKVPFPTYSTMQTTIGNKITEEQARLERLVKQHITKYAKEIIHSLITKKNGLYPLSALKLDPRSFRQHDIKKEIEKHEKCKKLFKFSKRFLPKLGISKSNINYYASLAIYYDMYHLKRLSENKVSLYIICFIHNQFYKINNNLIDSFIHYIRSYDKKADDYANEKIKNLSIEINDYKPKLGKVLDLFSNKKMSHASFKKVKNIAFKHVSEDEMKKLSKTMKRGKLDKNEFLWEYHCRNRHATAINLRPLFMTIDFKCAKSSNYLYIAAKFMHEQFKQGKSLNKIKTSDFPVCP